MLLHFKHSLRAVIKTTELNTLKGVIVDWATTQIEGLKVYKLPGIVP